MTQTEPLSKLIDSEKSLSHRSPSSLSASRAFASCVAATLQRRHFQNEVRYHHQLHHKRRNGGVWPILCRFLIVSLISFLFPGRRRLSQNLRNNESRVIVCSSARISETTTKRSEDGESQVVFAIICSTTLCTCVASFYKHINPSLGNFLLTERRRQSGANSRRLHSFKTTKESKTQLLVVVHGKSRRKRTAHSSVRVLSVGLL